MGVVKENEAFSHRVLDGYCPFHPDGECVLKEHSPTDCANKE
ncbi:hypothetical protein ACGFX8_32165 [Streptomyces sp. NPDC048362]